MRPTQVEHRFNYKIHFANYARDLMQTLDNI